MLIKEEGVNIEQIYSLDETGLNVNLLNENICHSARNSAASFKQERITFTVCTNATGM